MEQGKNCSEMHPHCGGLGMNPVPQEMKPVAPGARVDELKELLLGKKQGRGRKRKRKLPSQQPL